MQHFIVYITANVIPSDDASVVNGTISVDAVDSISHVTGFCLFSATFVPAEALGCFRDFKKATIPGSI